MAVILRFVGVVPLVELTNNQFEPMAVLDTTEKAMGLPSVLVTARFWNEDAPEPAVAVKVAPFGLNTSSAVVLTTSPGRSTQIEDSRLTGSTHVLIEATLMQHRVSVGNRQSVTDMEAQIIGVHRIHLRLTGI